MDRSILHRLVDMLPDGTLENAKRILERLINPPPLSPQMERMKQIRQEQMERMRRSIQPGTTGGFAGGGMFNPTTGYGHHAHTHWEDDTVVHESLHFFNGHEILVIERLRFTGGQTAIQYVHEVKGPKGKPVRRNEVVLDF